MTKLEKHIGIVMRVGVATALALIVVGFILLCINPVEMPQSQPLTAEFIASAFVSFNPWAVIMLGIFALILTPLLRVVVSIITFAAERDKLYVAITSGVLLILILSFVIAMASLC